MKKLFLTVILLNILLPAFSQTINFDHGWEMFRIDSAAMLKTTIEVRKGTSFASQFNQEKIVNKNEPADSAIAREVREAITGFKNEYPLIRSQKWLNISLPHPARYENELNPGINQFTGICYYRKQFAAAPAYKGKVVYLHFEGAMQTASVWVNGKFVMQHQGGYLPFNVPLGNLNTGGKNEVIVRLDNRDNKNVPPGKPLATLGFLYWSGIYRSVQLVVKAPLHITDPTDANTVAGGGVFVRPANISAASADLLIKTQLKNAAAYRNGAVIVKQILGIGTEDFCSVSASAVVDANSVAEVDQKITVLTPRLWSPDAPVLYRLKTEVWSDGKLVDRFSQKISIRKLAYSRAEGFKLNDKPLRIVGTNRHQDCPVVGNALTAEAQFRDLKRIKKAGFNFIRLSHYPQDPSVYDICDSLGIMLGDPIPGWQFFNDSELFKSRVFKDIREMIRRDRNHPSVIMWEVSLNETYPSDSFRIQSSRVAHEEYPGDNFFTSGDTYGAKHTEWDVPYNSWEDPISRPQNIQPKEAGFVREYGDYEFGGATSTTRVNRGDGEKALLQNAWNFQWEHNLLQGPAYYPWTIGDANWAFFDGFEAFSKNTSNWGVMDVYRHPKFSYYFYRSQLSPTKSIFGADNKPEVFIANWWTPTTQPQKVVVYANCDEVALYINGKLFKKQQPDAGPDTDYGDFEKGGNSFDGGNSTHLDHPPFTFNNVQWQAGKLTAIGYIKGKKVATQNVNTPLKATKLRLIPDDQGLHLAANGADVIFVNALITDKKGTVMCLDNTSRVTFTVKGNGVIVGPRVVKAMGGIATVLVRAGEKPGAITITATRRGLKPVTIKY
ncbi:beta-galactosidase [Mucilaginibacter pineti]|uniref:Beta-galactosidase n=1 Tax=Mucilaginibacter pineti TaxID=1391627 RepID=A0A1G7LPU9_9SPHI|nr:glycoside hydrolase family 2 TIM barrel-domain containing protein [Mucilaginibacter pineti]SDF51515.1 beta-galactosidase [Mucilaginibacter pineti]